MKEHCTARALVAAEEQKKAIEAFYVRARRANDADDCETPEYRAAEKLFSAKDEIFADADPTSLEGAIAKLRAVLEIEFDPLVDPLGARHLRGVIPYLERLAGDTA